MIVQFLIGVVIGAGVVGSSVHRTLSVGQGRLTATTVGAHLNSLFYFFSVSFIAKDNLSAYFGTVLGSWVISLYMAWDNKKQRSKMDQLAKSGAYDSKKL